ncbi:MAG: hypothetical protein GY754_36420, partial [bacterium]|nr:hypothetical protein [bacterium]
VVSYGEHPVMEFDAGLDGALIINRFNLSYFYNSVGFEYYKKKSYREALSFFENAISCNPKNATAIFNSACMNGLLGEAADSVKNLSQLKRLKTKAARKYLKKVKRDKDFNKIRKTREFEKFMKSI